MSRESDHAFDQGFSDEDGVVDTVLGMADEAADLFVGVSRLAEDVGSALFAESQRERIAELFVLCFQMLIRVGRDLETS